MLEKTPLLQTVAPVGFHLLTSEVTDLTPKVVADFRAHPATATERLLKEGRVQMLDDRIERGLAVTFHWVTAELNGTTTRINGQHSSTTLANRIAANKFPSDLKVHREHYKVDSGDALAMLFRQFDERASARQPIDISGVYQGLHPELDNVNRKIGKLAIDGYAWYMRNKEKVPTPIGDDVYGAFNDTGLYPWIKWLNELFSVKSSEMRYPPIVAAIVGTYMVNESAARTFWQDVVRLPNGDDEQTAQVMLSLWLIEIQAKKIDRPDPANLYQGCVYAWNAYRDGKSITAIRDDIKKNFYTIHD